MIIVIPDRDPAVQNAVCAIGGFDGVHRGHQAIIKEAVAIAAGTRKTGVITFSPAPAAVLKGTRPLLLTPDDEQTAIFQDLGLDLLFRIPFTRDFAHMDPEAFVRFIADRIAPAAVVIGENFRFGRDRRGHARHLVDLARHAFPVKVMSPITDDGIISSTRIRELLLLGTVTVANRLLGRPYRVTGEVIEGKGAGRLLGFPTINIEPPPEKLLPLEGVYRSRVSVDGASYAGAMFCSHRLVEVHLLDFTGRLYDRPVTIEIMDRLRAAAKFPDREALRQAIADDIARIRSRGPDPTP